MAASQPSESADPTALYWTVLSDLSADINLLTHLQGPPHGLPARCIEFNTAGDLVVTKPNGTNETVTGTVGYQIMGQVQKIVASGTTVTKVTVYW